MVSCFNWFLQNTCAACGGARGLSRSPGTMGLGPVLRGDLSPWTWKHVLLFYCILPLKRTPPAPTPWQTSGESRRVALRVHVCMCKTSTRP